MYQSFTTCCVTAYTTLLLNAAALRAEPTRGLASGCPTHSTCRCSGAGTCGGARRLVAGSRFGGPDMGDPRRAGGPVGGWVRGTVARSTRAAGYSHVARYGRAVLCARRLGRWPHPRSWMWPRRPCRQVPGCLSVAPRHALARRALFSS